MDDEKGLDLSLGLPCGGNSSSHKGKYSSSSDIKSDDGHDRGSKLINDFKNFLEGGSQQHPLNIGENFYNSFPNSSVDPEASKNSNTGGKIWPTNEIEEKRSSVGEKRKNNSVTETSQQKRQERETNRTESTDKTKVSHISITTDEGSTAENDDVADSEMDGSTSRLKGVEVLGQKNRFTVSSEKEFNVMPYGASFPSQPLNMMNMSYSQPPHSMMMHAMGSTNGERTAVQPANFPLMFGYSPVQLPALDRDNSRGVVSHHQQIHPVYSGRNSVNPDTHNDIRKLNQVISHKPTESPANGKGYGKQQVGEEGGSSSQTEGDPKVNHQVKDAAAAAAPDQPRAESATPTEFPAIRPGIAADLKFGGSGSYPNLPWVSTTGSGPTGRTISGVTYRYSPTQVRIVCACHGSHMSPDEFVRHAGEENNAPDGLDASFPSGNPAASAQT
ncbi:hypothetical protein ABFX02_11G051200 [Erythranthe guttata]